MSEQTRGMWLYLKIVGKAMDDDILTDDEAQILHVLAESLGLSPSDTAECLAIVRGDEPNPFTGEEDYSGHYTGDVTTYQTALIAALDDEVISEDEWAMLNTLREVLGIQNDEHAMIEEAIRASANSLENGERRIERLERFIVVCPYC